ncbi:MAG: hypothetical protein GX045_11080 [Clostridiaceae bacterium]|nr:hypothetical protein [Clostridiaceae bacterium]
MKQQMEITKLKNIIGDKNVTVEVDGTIQIINYVGFFATRELRLQILPKILADTTSVGFSEEEQKQIALNIMFKLLYFSGYLNVKNIPKPQQMQSYEYDLLEIYISIFTQQLEILLKRQVHRSYEICRENQQIIRGKICFHDTLTENAYRKHLHVVEYEEFTQDNLLNRILKETVCRLHKITQSEANRRALKICLLYLGDVNRITLTGEVFARIRFNRLNQEYNPVFQLARMFFYHLQPGSWQGEQQTYSFLVPLNALFEYYLYHWIKKHKNFLFHPKARICYQSPYIRLAESIDGGAFLLKPDITVLENESDMICIIDAKYKDIQNVSQSDIYQMLAYAAGFDCTSICLVYPRFIGAQPVHQQYMIDAFGKKITITIQDVDLLETDIKLRFESSGICC